MAAQIEELNLAQQCFVVLTTTRHRLWEQTGFYLTKLGTSPDPSNVRTMIESAIKAAQTEQQMIDKITLVVTDATMLAALTSGLVGTGCTIGSANALYVAVRDALAAWIVALAEAQNANDFQTACTTFQAAVPEGVYLP